MTNSSNPFAGTWKLISFEYRAEDGTSFLPFGKEVEGILQYDNYGYMSAIISRMDRHHLSKEDQTDVSDHEKIELTRGFIAYSGRYEILPDKILHHVIVSFIPNYMGTTIERYYSFKDGELVLSSPPLALKGKDFTGHLTWRPADRE